MSALERLKAWCVANGATFRQEELSGGVELLTAETSDGQVWRTSFRRLLAVPDAERREAKAWTLFTMLEHKYKTCSRWRR